jgi:hypothetical protein
MLLDYFPKIERDYIGNGDLIGSTAALRRLLDVPSADVGYERCDGAISIALAAASAFPVISVFDVPHRDVGEFAGVVPFFGLEPETWGFALCRHSSLISEIAPNVV